MRDTIDMAREVYGAHTEWTESQLDRLEQVVALARADEREQGQRWYDAVTAQHKQLILAEREACAKVAEDFLTSGRSPLGCYVADAIRARGNK
jgi:hypothetical protein